MTEYMNVHSNFGMTHIMMNVGWIDAIKGGFKKHLEVRYTYSQILC